MNNYIVAFQNARSLNVLMRLGLALATAHHTWTNGERFAWERRWRELNNG